MTLPDYIKDIADFLQSNLIGTQGTDVFIGGFDTTPNCVSVNAVTGSRQQTSTGGDVLYQPELNIGIRDRSGKAAELRARSIHTLLNLQTNKIIGSTRFQRIEAISDPFLVSKSEQEGTIYSINFHLKLY